MERIILGVEALDFLEKEGFPVLKSRLAKAKDDAGLFASEIGFPVALKVCSPHAIHKTEINGVRYPLNNPEEVQEAFIELVENFKLIKPEKDLDGIMVQRLGSGVELIIGIHKDKQFGHVIMLGIGGIFVEAIRDVSFRMIPIEKDDARDMIGELQAYRIFTSPRYKGIDIRLVEDLLIRVSQLIIKHNNIKEMDMNPVFLSQTGIHICDARIIEEERSP